MNENALEVDCVVIGGGPGGLTAGIYVARYRRRVVVFDEGCSRAALIPKTRNYPGFAHGITGPDLLAALTAQAEDYGVRLIICEARSLEREGQMFRAAGRHGEIRATHAILATGLIDQRPEIEGFEPGADGKLVRYCPICDGYEATDKDICVYGNAEDACGKALFSQNVSKSVTLLTPDGCRPDEICRELAPAGVRLPGAKVVRLRQQAGKMMVEWPGATLRSSLPHSGLRGAF
jgi:thioredoxin reductase (NADPH)